jgi:TatD DNase family protein
MAKKSKREIPKFNTPIIETHFHLDYLKDAPSTEILDLAKNSGVNKFITIAVSPENLDNVLSIAKSYTEVFCTQGIHPHEAKEFTDETEAKIRENAKSEKVLAIGEIGLDYHYTHSPKEVQIEIFKRQLEIAIELDKPVVIHTREAEEDTIKVLSEYAPRMNKKGVIHSFTSSIELAKICIDLGFNIGFNGIITFKSAQNVRDVLAITPLDKILLETDAPFLTPTPYRGVENSPKYLPFIAEKAAEVKEVEVEDLLKQVLENSLNLFQIPN